MTLLTPEDCRKAAGIEVVWLPEHLYTDYQLTLWGDTILEDGRRTRGELFFDESVQLMLALGGVLDLYTKYVRHFRTLHLPFSPKVLKGDLGDDRVISDMSQLEGHEIVVTAKMDGGQVTLYDDHMHLRSIDFKPDPTTSRLQAIHSAIKHNLGGLRVNVENLIGSAVTGIQYNRLKSHYQIWGVWDNDKNVCMSWDDTEAYASMLDVIVRQEGGYEYGMPLVKTLYRGPFDRDVIKGLLTATLDGDELEGLVVRVARSFRYGESAKCVGKFVREHHTVRHGGPYIANHLAGVTS
jgi:hypothetical protein